MREREGRRGFQVREGARFPTEANMLSDFSRREPIGRTRASPDS